MFPLPTGSEWPTPWLAHHGQVNEPQNNEMQRTSHAQNGGSPLIPGVGPTFRSQRHSGYNLARVRFEIVLSPDAGGQLAALPAHTRAEVRDGIELHLRYEPTKLSKSRIKRLRGLEQPQYRLRIG